MASVKWLQSLKRAHHKLLTQLDKRERWDYWYEELTLAEIQDAIERENNVLCESSEHWGGLWTQQKLNTFEKYVNAYLTIMNKWRDKLGLKLIYFDGFAGSGSKKTDNNNIELMTSLFDRSHIGDVNVYKGAAERVMDISQRGFDYYYFVDKDKESNEKLEQKLDKYKKDKHLIFRHGDSNEEILLHLYFWILLACKLIGKV